MKRPVIRNNKRDKRVLGLETVGDSRGNGSSSDEDGGGDFHLDHDEDFECG